MQAKTFYFSKETGEILNIEDYQEWKRTVVQGTAEPEYSSNYQKVVEMILSGKEKDIPGIMQIPDTVLEGQGSESKTSPRKKPWELEQKDEQDDQETKAATE